MNCSGRLIPKRFSGGQQRFPVVAAYGKFRLINFISVEGLVAEKLKWEKIMTTAKHVAFVTGASRGIGAGIARALGANGVAVAVGFNQNAEGAEEVARTIVGEGGRAVAVAIQIEGRVSVRQALQTAGRHLGTVDILVNNAGIAQEKPFDTITDGDWARMLAVNLQGPFICSQEALPYMLDQGWGRIINITSIGGQWGGFNQVHYAAAKAGLINLTRSLAKIYSARGVTTNAVAPGLILTDMSANEMSTEAGRQKVAQIPAGRTGSVEEVGAVAAFLASEEAAYVTGQTVNVNGGQYFV
jgi:acetoacetyl-CoA reductase/3-oxoacyl-[acyl-carrier protein] reductase